MGRSLLPPNQATPNFLEEGELLNNPPYSFVYADQDAREAATGFVAGDVGKLARQTNDNSLWMLTNHSPITWKDTASGSQITVTLEGVVYTEEPNGDANLVFCDTAPGEIELVEVGL